MELPIENQRVKKIIEYFCNGNELQFSKEIKISQPRINRLFSIDSRSGKFPMVSFEIIQAIINKYIDVDSEWLITGKGSMLKENMIINLGDPVSIYGNRKTKDAIIQVQEVPFYDGLKATMGLQALFESGKPTETLETIKIPNLPKCDGAISVTGDSMYPLLKSGDIVLYKQTSVDSIFYGEMYLLSVKIEDWEEYVTVKYVQKSEKGENYIKLVSQNQHHQSRDIMISQISAIAMIKASIRYNTMF